MTQTSGKMRFQRDVLALRRHGAAAHDLPQLAAAKGACARVETIEVRIPAGRADGSRVRVPGRGNAGTHGAPRAISTSSPKCSRIRFSIGAATICYTVVPITVTEAALGAKIEVPTIDGRSLVRVPPGTNSGTEAAPARKGRAFGAAHGQARRSDMWNCK